MNGVWDLGTTHETRLVGYAITASLEPHDVDASRWKIHATRWDSPARDSYPDHVLMGRPWLKADPQPERGFFHREEARDWFVAWLEGEILRGRWRRL